MSGTVPDPLDSAAIRRRLARDYVVVMAPSVLNASTVVELLDGLVDTAENADIVIDLRRVDVCDPAVLPVLGRVAGVLRAAGIGITLSHPSPVCEEMLDAAPGAAAVEIRRPRRQRPLRHSMRGQVGDV